MQGLIAKKLGMTQVFDKNGRRLAVTVLEVGPCVVVQRKTVDRDGYEAVQLGFGDQKESRMRKPALGSFKKLEASPKRYVKEFAVDADEAVEAGATVSVTDVFEGIGYVDVIGLTKGRGYQGVVKRHNMGGGRASHGGGLVRTGGSIGQCSTPSKVAKGRRMPGHMGRNRITTQNLKVVDLDGENHLMLVSGSVPGAVGSIVWVNKALKKAAKNS